MRASWRRDRAVARRRIAARWLGWLATRWILPVVMATALGEVPAMPTDDLPLPAVPRRPEQGMRIEQTMGPARAASPVPPASRSAPPSLPLKLDANIKSNPAASPRSPSQEKDTP